MSELFIHPSWPAPASVSAASTTRAGGVSRGCYASFNLGGNSGDDPLHVAANRERLTQALCLPRPWYWLRQVHGVQVVDATRLGSDDTPADAVFTREAGIVCAIRTADCLPVLFSCRQASVVAAAHAGWRGLCAGVLESTVRAMDVPASHLMAWIGPAIGARNYEVGDEVREAFLAVNGAAAEAFSPTRPGHWLADLEALARQRLGSAGVGSVHGGGRCTFADATRFFSYRRDGDTGRMASLIWIRPSR